jgi:hypothetical protein
MGSETFRFNFWLEFCRLLGRRLGRFWGWDGGGTGAGSLIIFMSVSLGFSASTTFAQLGVGSRPRLGVSFKDSTVSSKASCCCRFIMQLSSSSDRAWLVADDIVFDVLGSVTHDTAAGKRKYGWRTRRSPVCFREKKTV